MRASTNTCLESVRRDGFICQKGLRRDECHGDGFEDGSCSLAWREKRNSNSMLEFVISLEAEYLVAILGSSS